MSIIHGKCCNNDSPLSSDFVLMNSLCQPGNKSTLTVAVIVLHQKMIDSSLLALFAPCSKERILEVETSVNNV